MWANNRFGHLAIIPTDPESGLAVPGHSIILRGKRKKAIISREFPETGRATLGTGGLQKAWLVKKMVQKWSKLAGITITGFVDRSAQAALFRAEQNSLSPVDYLLKMR